MKARLWAPGTGRKVWRKARSLVAKRLFRDPGGGPSNTVVVAGVARSGTTWLGEVIASQTRARIMFEPFHSTHVPGFRDFERILYMRPGTDDPALRAFAHDVLSGALRNPRWVDRQADRIFPRCRVIKDVRMCLLLRWLHERFPETPIVYIVRHPCAMVASHTRVGWTADLDLDSMLRQPELIEDHLSGLMPVVRAATAPHQKHALVWCIGNRVVLRQFEGGRLDLVRYEDLVRRPEVEVPRVFEAIDRPFDESVFRQLQRPSYTVPTGSPLLDGKDPTRTWTSVLSAEQIDDVMEIVRAFGLDHLYGDDDGAARGADAR